MTVLKNSKSDELNTNLQGGEFYPISLTTAERDAISTPVTSSIIYNSTTNKLNVYTGSAWEAITSA